MLIFLDVDGVLIPLRSRPARSWSDPGNPLLERVDPDDGPRLLGLGGSLVWATTWMDDANDAIAPRLGLPRLPVVDFPDDDEFDPGSLGSGDRNSRVHWKTVHLTRWAADRPFIWLDDEITDADRRWVAAHHPGPALLHRVDPQLGLGDSDFLALRDWLGSR